MDNITKFEDADSTKIQLGTLISIMHKSYASYLYHSTQDMDISLAEIPFLFKLSREKELAQEELANHCHKDKGAVARTLKKMEDDGLITREIDETNRRKYKVLLTKKGEELAIEIKKINKNWEDTIYKKVEPLSKKELHDLLKEIGLETLKMSENF